MESIKLFSIRERRHFMKCECGEYFDMRDQKDVMKHLHKFNQSKADFENADQHFLGDHAALKPFHREV